MVALKGTSKIERKKERKKEKRHTTLRLSFLRYGINRDPHRIC